MEKNNEGLTIAIIAAKGNSKGVPNKNIKLLGGKPLIAYTIEAAKNLSVIDRVFVSTDSKKIADISKKYGAEIIWETVDIVYPYNLATESYLRFAADEIKKQGIKIKIIVFLQCTSPFTSSKIIKKAINKIYNEGYDSIISIFPTYRYFGRFEGGIYIPFRKTRKRRQEMIPWYCDNGALYVLKGWVLRELKNRYGGKVGIVEMSEEDSLEIDKPNDWWLAEQIIKKKKRWEGLK